MSKRNKQPQQQRNLTTTYTGVAFSGPLPPPTLLEKYNEIVPGAAERLLAMAEKQADHRRFLEKKVVGGNARSQTVGQWMAFSLSLLVIGLGAFLLWHDKPLGGLGAIISALSALVAVFIAAKKLGGQEREKKRRDLDQRT